MTSATELLPCPFCGGEAEMLTAESMHGGDLFGIMCQSCCSRGDVYDTEAEAIAAWNTRADYHGYEQAAIEAWKSIKTWNTRATHGTLTAEQVEKTIHDCSTYASYDGCTYYASGIRLQAIADELNARAERTCRIIEYDEAPYPVCSECGAVQPDDYTVYFCWNCGAKVRDA